MRTILQNPGGTAMGTDTIEAVKRLVAGQSRAARKRELVVRRLEVVRLLLLSEREMRRLDLPSGVVDVLLETRRMRRGNARQRQIRYLTRLVDDLRQRGER